MQKVRWFSGKPGLPSELPGTRYLRVKKRLEISTEITLIGIADQMGALPDGFPLEEKFSGIVEFGVDDTYCRGVMPVCALKISIKYRF